MKELGETIYNTTAFVQHLTRTEEGWRATITLMTWRTPAAMINDHVILSWYENYSTRLECCQLLKPET